VTFCYERPKYWFMAIQYTYHVVHAFITYQVRYRIVCLKGSREEKKGKSQIVT